MGFVDKWVYFWNVRGLGKGQFSQILDLLNFNFVAMILLLLKDYFPDVNPLFVFAGAFIIETVCLLGGVILERKFHFINSQQKFSNRRNDDLQEILVRLKRIEIKMMK